MPSSPTTDTIAGEPPPAARPPAVLKSRRGRLRADRFAHHVVMGGGFLIIASILAILFVIAAEVIPLFRKPSASAEPRLAVGDESILRVGTDEYRALVYAVTATGIVVRTAEGALYALDRPLAMGTAAITAVSHGIGETFAVGLNDGTLVPISIGFGASFSKNKRSSDARIVRGEPLRVDAAQPIRLLAYADTPEGPAAAVRTGPRRLHLIFIRQTENLMGEVTREEVRHDVELSCEGEISALCADSRGDTVFAGTSRGETVVIDTRDKDGAPVVRMTQYVSEDRIPITVLGLLVGDRTVVVGDARGRVSSWQLLKTRFARIHDFDPHDAPVTAFSSSLRNKSFATLDAEGGTAVRFGTTGRTLMTLRGATPATAIAFAPKGDGLVTGEADGGIARWTLRNFHPETTWRALFGKLWYEGYEEPAYVWQSTGGTDDFEPKLSLTPLIYGTLKGTFYALMFAVPLALLAALYASQFMHPSLRGVIKPAVEIMAALPSVVLGFIAGLWLAPAMERIVPGLMLMPLGIALCILAALVLWQRFPSALRKRVKPGAEVFLLIPVVLLGGWVSVRIGFLLESWMMAGDYRTWLLKALGLTYDQRNSMVVGLAMGFAIVPIIFTIAEDSLSSVPNHLKAGSLALGATPWQTAIRVVLPTASPGIFSAVMIGLGRAVGETMIVLMATGNTPVMNGSIFSGFRALSANIAVELPEAPYRGTLYRVLFLAALLLFAMTFVLNTLAELIRLRLRKRYRAL
jgi:phosphate transport system permease protein